jgi:hypothetical protein
MTDNLAEDVKHWKDIELFFTKNKCGNIHQIAESIGCHWITTQKEMRKLEEIGRVEREGNIYFLNGIDQWQKRVDLNDSHSLFIDTFRTTFGNSFVRIKETKKEDGKWRPIGNIMITKNKIKEVAKFLERIDENIQSLK